MNRERIGSKLDSMFEDLGELEEVRAAWQSTLCWTLPSQP